ncbi:MAG: type VI secretion system protein TssA [Planctomycetes bacterium]|nr:type VI secretion system protein TssA [Planctomycetota bacterium]
MPHLADLATIGSTAISGDSPTGASVRYEPEYEKIQLEIEKLQSVAQDQVRWDDVVNLAAEILSQKSKDLLVASYLAAGLLNEAGYSGLATGLGAFKDLIVTFWDKLFPPVEKMRGREAAVRWLDERAAKMVTERPQPSESDREALETCVKLLQELGGLLGEKFTESPVGFGDLSRAVEDKLYAIPAQAAPATDAGGSSETASGDAGAVSAAESYAPPPPEAIDSPDKVREIICKAVEFLKGANPGDPLAFELERIVLWSPIAEVPDPAPAGGDPALIDSWEVGLKKKEYQRVLDEAEVRLPMEPLWLDLNLYATRAMEGLGSAFDAARAAVGAQVAALVQRLPDLLNLTFEGGVKAAGDLTRQWIENELARSGATRAAPADANRLDETLREARKLATRSKLPAATALVQKEMLLVPPGRSKFLWRLGLAKLCADSNKPALAVPQLEALDEESVRIGLEQWEPELATEVVRTLWQCYSSLAKSDEAMSEKASRAYARLCRLDLGAAMALDGKR